MSYVKPRRHAARRIGTITAGALSLALAVAIVGGPAPARAAAAVPTNLTFTGHVSLGAAAASASQGEVTVGLYSIDGGADTPYATTTTDASGNYQLNGVGGPFHWGLKFTDNGPGGYLTTWWSAGGGVSAPYASYAGEATYTILPTSTPTVADITLPLPGAINGTATTSSGAVPFEAAMIRVTATRFADNHSLYPYYQPDTLTENLNADGTYSFAGLMPGSYKLSFETFSTPPVFAVSAAGATVADPAANVVQVVGSGQTLDSVDTVMFSAARVTAAITCPGCAMPPSPSYPPMMAKIFRQTPAGWAYVSLSPTYGDFSNLSMLPGTYRIVAWVNNGPQLGWGHSSTFTLAEGQRGTADVVITRPSTARLAGADRFGTSVAISQNTLDSAKEFSPHVPVVYIANGLAYADALSAGPAAAAQQGPLLLVAPTSIPAAVGAELKRLQPQKIVVVGGAGSVSNAVFAQLTGYVSSSSAVVRVAGIDRYSTSLAIAEYAFPSGASTAYLATGANFPDALSAGGAAAEKSAPVILVRGSAASVDLATRNALTGLHVSTIDIVGGTGTVSAAFQSAVQAIPGMEVTRVAGSDRYATSRAVDEDAFMAAWFADAPSNPLPFAFLAVGTNFPDALSGGALAGHLGAPLFVIPSNCIPQAVMQDLEDLQVSTLVLLGGTGSLTAAVSSFTACPS
jgi:putative cell wall-binding protein